MEKKSNKKIIIVICVFVAILFMCGIYFVANLVNSDGNNDEEKISYNEALKTARKLYQRNNQDVELKEDKNGYIIYLRDENNVITYSFYMNKYTGEIESYISDSKGNLGKIRD